MSSLRPVSMRGALERAFLVLGGVALLACVALVVYAHFLHQTARELNVALQGLSLVNEAKSLLGMHVHTRERAAQARIEGHMRDRLASVRHHVKSPEEILAVESAASAVERYLGQRQDAQRDPASPELAAAFSAVHSLLEIEQANAWQAHEKADVLLTAAHATGLGAAVLLVAGVVVSAFWIRSRVLRPTLDLATAIERFGAGEKALRADEQGVAELRDAAARFNTMAARLARQRECQLSFLAGVAHDLRNPLSALRASLATISADGPLPDEGRVRCVLERVRRQVDRLERMAGDLLDAARVESGRLELQSVRCELRAVVRDVVDLFADASRTHPIELHLPEREIPVCVDVMRMEQLLGNLVANAIKYSPRGGRVLVSLEVKEGMAAVSVTDEGIGIPADELPHIFEPFRRAHVSAESIPGIGLGLSVAQRIADAHGGRITVESAEGVGSTFRFEVPLEAISPKKC